MFKVFLFLPDGSPPPMRAATSTFLISFANLLATAFHPELTGDLRVHGYFVEMVRRR